MGEELWNLSPCVACCQVWWGNGMRGAVTERGGFCLGLFFSVESIPLPAYFVTGDMVSPHNRLSEATRRPKQALSRTVQKDEAGVQ